MNSKQKWLNIVTSILIFFLFYSVLPVYSQGCFGTVLSCSGLQRDDCFQQKGCFWDSANCEGSSASCFTMGNKCNQQDGCFWVEARCSGPPTPCESLSYSTCSQQPGCYKDSGYGQCNQTSVGKPGSCNYTNKQDCESVSNAICYWQWIVPPGCKGSPESCAGNNSYVQCISIKGCSFSPAKCSGYATECSSFDNQFSCSKQRGCNWDEEGPCQGNAKKCSEFTSTNTCLAQKNCSWDETPPELSDNSTSQPQYQSFDLIITCNDSGSGCKNISYCIASQPCNPNKSEDISSGSIKIPFSCNQNECKYVVSYFAEDKTGNASTTKNTQTITITSQSLPQDTTLPELSDNAPANWQNSDVKISITCFDSESGCNEDSVQYSIDNQPFIAGNTVTVTKEGITEIQYKGQDKAGNQAQKTTQVKIDKTPPETPKTFSGQPENNAVKLTWTQAQDNLSGTKKYHLYTRKEGEPTLKKIKETTQLSQKITGLENQTKYYFDIQAEDNAGNLSQFKGEITVTPKQTDTQPPKTTANYNPEWQNSNTTIKLTCTDNISGCKKTEYKTNNNQWQTYTQPITITTEGITQIQFKSTDNTGNTEQEKKIQIKIDKTAPLKPENLIAIGSGKKIVLRWVQSNDIGSGVSSYLVYKNNKVLGETSQTIFEDTEIVSGKTYAYFVKAKDNAGNTSVKSNEVKATHVFEENITEDNNTVKDQNNENTNNYNDLNQQETKQSLSVEPPKNINVYMFEDQITLVWGITIDDNTLYYEVWKKTGNQKYKLVSNTRKTFFEDKNVLLGRTYFYKIRSVSYTKNKSNFSKEVITEYVKSNLVQQEKELEIYHFDYSPGKNIMEGETFKAIVLAHHKKGLKPVYFWNFGDEKKLSGKELETILHNYYITNGLDSQTFLLKVKAIAKNDVSNELKLEIKVRKAIVFAKLLKPETSPEKAGEKNEEYNFLFKIEGSNAQITKKNILNAKASIQQQKMNTKIKENAEIEARKFLGLKNTSPAEYTKLEYKTILNKKMFNGTSYFSLYLKPKKIFYEIKPEFFYLGQKIRNIKLIQKENLLPEKISAVIESIKGVFFPEVSLEEMKINSGLVAEPDDMYAGIKLYFKGKDIYGNIVDENKIIKIKKDNPAFNLKILKPKKSETTFNFTQPVKIEFEVNSFGKRIKAGTAKIDFLGKTIQAKFDENKKTYYAEIKMPPKKYGLNKATIKIIASKNFKDEKFLDFETIKVFLTAKIKIKIKKTVQKKEKQTEIVFKAEHINKEPVKQKNLTTLVSLNDFKKKENAEMLSTGEYKIVLKKTLNVGENLVEVEVKEDLSGKTQKQLFFFKKETIAIIILAILMIIILFYVSKKMAKKQKQQQEKIEKINEEIKKLELLKSALRTEYLKRNITEKEFKERYIDTLKKIRNKKIEKRKL